VRRLLVKANVVSSSPILVTLMKEALSSSGTLVLTRATRRNIPEDAILHSRRRENLKLYIDGILFKIISSLSAAISPNSVKFTTSQFASLLFFLTLSFHLRISVS
jgi:hypothetical protein